MCPILHVMDLACYCGDLVYLALVRESQEPVPPLGDVRILVLRTARSPPAIHLNHKVTHYLQQYSVQRYHYPIPLPKRTSPNTLVAQESSSPRSTSKSGRRSKQRSPRNSPLSPFETSCKKIFDCAAIWSSVILDQTLSQTSHIVTTVAFHSLDTGHCRLGILPPFLHLACHGVQPTR